MIARGKQACEWVRLKQAERWLSEITYEEDTPGNNVHEGAVGERISAQEARDRECARRRSESIHKETLSVREARRELARAGSGGGNG